MTVYVVLNADGSEYCRVMYRELAEAIVTRGLNDAWLTNKGMRPQAVVPMFDDVATLQRARYWHEHRRRIL